MKSHLFTALAVAAIAFALSAAHLLGPDELQAEQDVADDKAALIAHGPAIEFDRAPVLAQGEK